MDLKDQAEDLARDVLVSHWDGSMPVDPFLMARIFGIEIVTEHLAADVSGSIQKHGGHPARIHINGTDQVLRRRFTVAHELGHFLKNRGSDIDYVNYRDQTSSAGTNEEERFANGFAAALLMPENALVDYLETGMEIPQLAREFKVSKSALVNRLRNLEMLP